MFIEISAQHNPSVVPSRYLPRWAFYYGVKCSVMQNHCVNIDTPNKLPRGMEKRCEQLRPKLINAIKYLNEEPK